MSSKSKELYDWLKERPLISLNGVCKEVGYDRANFMKFVAAEKELKPDILEKFTVALSAYGFKSKPTINYVPATENAYKGNQTNNPLVSDEVGQMPNIVVAGKLAEYEAELLIVPDVGNGKLRRKWLQNKVFELRKQLK